MGLKLNRNECAKAFDVTPRTIDEWVLAGRVGAGVDFYLTRSLVLNVAATTVLTADEISSDFNLDDVGGLNYVAVQAGLQIRF